MMDDLTPRRREALALAHQGLATKEIAARMGITPGTAKCHLEAVYAALGVAERGATGARVLACLWYERHKEGA